MLKTIGSRIKKINCFSKRLGVFVFFLLALIFIIMTVRNLLLPASPLAENGQLNLGNWNFEKDGVASLNGDWGFYWGRFVENPEKEQPDAYVRVPEVWTNYRLNGDRLPGFGYATYTLNLSGIRGELSLHIDPCSTSYELYIDNRLVAQNGTIGKNSSEAIPYYAPKTVTFTADKPETTIKLYVSNYTYARGGLWYHVLLGTPCQLAHKDRYTTYQEVFLAGIIFTDICLCVGAILIGLRYKSLYYLIMMSLCALVGTLTYGDYLIMRIVGNFHTAVTLEYIYVNLFPMFIALFLQSLLGGKKHFIIRLIVGVCTFIFLFTVITPVSVFTRFTGFMEILDISIVIYLIVCIIKSHCPFKGTLLIGTIIMAAGGITDCLYQACIITRIGNVAPVGYSMMMYVNGIAFLQYYQHTVKERQMALEQSRKSELALLNSQVKPHFIYNTLNTISYFCTNDPKEANRLVLFLAKYLRNSLDFFNLENKVTLKHELEHVQAYMAIQLTRFSKVEMNYVIEAEESLMIPPFILQPLVENALQHGIRPNPEGGTITLTARSRKDTLSISVEDNGVGAESAQLEQYIKEPQAGGGIGLYNINERLKKYYGTTLDIQSEPGRGTKISLTILYNEPFIKN